MKNLIAIVMMSLIAVSANASSYSEKALAQCGRYQLVEVTIGSFEIGGTVSETTSYVVRFEDIDGMTETPATLKSVNDVDAFDAVLDSESNLRISKSFEIGTGETYRSQYSSWGKREPVALCQKL